LIEPLIAYTLSASTIYSSANVVPFTETPKVCFG
jgi:hypothetical protein